MAKVKAKVITKVKKKFWYPILAPKIFGNKVLGETYLTEPQVALGRTLKYNLRELTGGMRDQHVYLTFQINNLQNNNLYSELIGYQMTPASIKRIVRRYNDRSDDSFVVVTADNKKVRFKTLILTVHNTKRSINSALKKTMMELVAEETKKINFGNMIDKLVSHKLQNEIKKKLSKIYPTKSFEIKYMGLERVKGAKKIIIETPVEEVKKEEPKEEEVKKETPAEVKEEKKETVKETIEKAEETVTEKAVEKVVEKVEKLPEEKAEKAAEELVEEKVVVEEKKAEEIKE